MRSLNFDALIFGAGISGLWTFNTLRNKGLNVLLVETSVIGGVQTLASQGMIHGGQRYSLQGALTKHSESISAMPEIWNKALQGEIKPDLRSVKVLSEVQYLWSPGGLTSNVTSFFASKAMHSRVQPLKQEKWPEIFKAHKGFKGKLYELDEVVIDVKSLALALSNAGKEYILKPDSIEYNITSNKLDSVNLSFANEKVEAKASNYIFTAGAGNEEIANKLWQGSKVTQRRPLRQVVIDKIDYPLYAHCITIDPRPRVTVSSHPDSYGSYTWYLGGLVAVKHIDDESKTLAFALKEMQTLFPFIDWASKSWSTVLVDRAEPYNPSGLLPDGPSVLKKGNTLLAWPSKLTFAPALAQKILDSLEPACTDSVADLAGLNLAEVGSYPWEK